MYRAVSLLARTIVFLIIVPVAAFAQAGRIEGRVIDSATREPRYGVSVTIDGTRRGALSDSAGRFSIPDVAAGQYTLRTRQAGTRPATVTVDVRAGAATEVEIEVANSAVTLTAVKTTARPPERDRFELSPNVGAISLTPSTVRNVPAIGEPDVLRTVQLMPGVNARNDFSSGYNVRGGESDQNLILLDGYPIYNPFHLGGLFSTFLDETVGSIDLLTGGFGASHGGRLSSILDVKSADETRHGMHGTLAVSVISSSLTIGQASEDTRSNWTLSGRRTYADKLIAAISDQTFPYHFSDAQFHAVKALNKDNLRLAVTAYSGIDILDADIALFSDSAQNGGGEGGFKFQWSNQLVGASLTNVWRDGAHFPIWGAADSVGAEQHLSFTRFATGLDLGDGALSLTNSVHELRAAGDVHWHRGTHERRIGYEASTYAIHYDVNTSASAQLFTLGQHPISSSAYYTETWKPGKRLITEAGVRAEYLTGRNWMQLSPRVSAKFFVTPDLAISAAAGDYAQWMHSLNREDIPVRIFDFWVASDPYTNISKARHYVLGLEQWLGPLRFARIEGWVKQYDHVLEQNTGDDPSIRGDEFLDAKGTSYGYDLLLRQFEVGSVGGWLSYTYSKSTRTRDSTVYWPGHDRRHNLNVVASWRPSPKYVFGARLGVASGTPYTDIVGQIVRRAYNPRTHRFDDIRNDETDPIGGAHNAQRYPLTQRLDVSLSRPGQWRGMTVTPYVSIVNVYNASNVFLYTFDYTANPPTRTTVSQFPFLPSIGLTVSF